MFLSVRRCAEHMTQLPRLRSQIKVIGFTFEICVHSISPKLYNRFSTVSVRRCAEPMTRLRRLKVKVTLQGYVIYPSISVCSISTEPFEGFHQTFTLEFRVHFISPELFNLFSTVPLSGTICRTNDSATQTQSQGHTSWSWELNFRKTSLNCSSLSVGVQNP